MQKRLELIVMEALTRKSVREKVSGCDAAQRAAIAGLNEV